ncbi:MAG: protein kinase [Actinomycetota bacterium]|nr:protein kinase [Actinomycetota bacterium]
MFKEQAVGGGRTLEASVGTVLGGRYRVRSTLGTGGMAVVYKAEDAILGRCVALKTLHRRYAEDISFRSRFKQEARVMASLDHENIVKVYDISQEGEVPFIVAEYVEGQDVGSVLREAPDGRLGERFTRGLAGQLLEALDYAHRRGVIHRDIKPSNILLTREGTVKVADFGIARLVEEEEAGKPGEIIGSARYMSPEQLRGDETTPCSDLYSVGIILYHFLTGGPPFSGDTRSVARQQVYKDPPPPRTLNKEITPALEAVILKALAKDPEARYPSASAMLEDLRRSAKSQEVDPGESLGRRKRRQGAYGGGLSKKALLIPSMAALLLLGGGAAAASLGGYLGEASPWQSESALMTAAQPATEDSPEAPLTEATSETTGDEPEPASADEAEQTNTGLETQLTAGRLTPVPNVGTYFDYVAVEALRSSGFQTRVVYEYRPGYLNIGVTWGTDPVSGTLLPAGSTVVVYSTPVDQPQIPIQPQGQPFQSQFPI